MKLFYLYLVSLYYSKRCITIYNCRQTLSKNVKKLNKKGKNKKTFISLFVYFLTEIVTRNWLKNEKTRKLSFHALSTFWLQLSNFIFWKNDVVLGWLFTQIWDFSQNSWFLRDPFLNLSVRKLSHNVSFTRYWALLYFWQIKPILKIKSFSISCPQLSDTLFCFHTFENGLTFWKHLHFSL